MFLTGLVSGTKLMIVITTKV